MHYCRYSRKRGSVWRRKRASADQRMRLHVSTYVSSHPTGERRTEETGGRQKSDSIPYETLYWSRNGSTRPPTVFARCSGWISGRRTDVGDRSPKTDRKSENRRDPFRSFGKSPTTRKCDRTSCIKYGFNVLDWTARRCYLLDVIIQTFPRSPIRSLGFM